MMTMMPSTTMSKPTQEPTTQEPIRKKARMEPTTTTTTINDVPSSPMDFLVIVSSPHSLKSLLKNVNNVLIHANIQFCNGSSFQGIKIDSIDPTSRCMVKARYSCPVEFFSKDTMYTISVNLKSLYEILKRTKNDIVIKMYKLKTSSALQVEFEDNGIHEFSLKTRNDTDEPIALKDIKTDHTLEISIYQMKEFVRLAKNMKTSNLSIKIKQDIQTQFMYVELSFEGDTASAKRVFNTTMETNPTTGHQTISIGKDIYNDIIRRKEQKFKVIFDQRYSNMFIESFLKSMQRDHRIQIGLARDQAPLILHYDLGSQNSYIRYILAAVPK